MLAETEIIDEMVWCFTFYATIPAPIVVNAVAVAFVIGLIVLRVVRNKVPQGEAIVAGEEVD